MGEPIIIRKESAPTSESCELVDIQIIPTEFFILGQASITKVIRSRDVEGLTVVQIAEMTNISERAVWKQIHRHAVRTHLLDQSSLRSLRDAGVIPIRSTRSAFVSKTGVKQLLRHINTHESWAIYYQLWNNSEKLEVVEARLLETAGKLKTALDQNAIQKGLLRIKDQQIEDLSATVTANESSIAELHAKLDAADHHIALGGNKRSPKFSIPIYRREPNDIFNNPVYSIEVVRKSREEMDEKEHARFSAYHSVRTMAGLSLGLEKSFGKMGVTNDKAKSQLVIVSNAVTALRDEIEPNPLGLLALNNPGEPEYMN